MSTGWRVRRGRIGSRLVGALALVGALTLAGCGTPAGVADGTNGPAATTPSALTPTAATSAPNPPTASPVPATASSAPSPGVSPSSGPASAGPGPVTCATTNLAIGLGTGDGAAGSTYVPLEFTNTASFACLIRGFPGVSYVGGTDGHQIGAAAAEDTSTPNVQIVLQPGAKAHVTVRMVAALNYDPATCQPASARGLRIYPPGETHSAYVINARKVCSSTSVPQLTVSAMVAG